MYKTALVGRAALISAVAVITTVVALPVDAQGVAPGCDVPRQLIYLDHPLTRVGRKLATNEPVVIVAIGSSSTAGAGASSPAATYPSRLRDELGKLFRGHAVIVHNRGIGGEEIADMLKRFDEAVVAVSPDLVIWQLGTNSVIRNHPLADHGAAIHAGLEKIRGIRADVVLIDPQYAPKVITKPDAEGMVDLIAITAKREGVDLFHRFELMRHWASADKMDFGTFISPDGLHMNDWSYACMAKGLGLAIADAAQRPVVSAHAAAGLQAGVP